MEVQDGKLCPVELDSSDAADSRFGDKGEHKHRTENRAEDHGENNVLFTEVSRGFHTYIAADSCLYFITESSFFIILIRLEEFNKIKTDRLLNRQPLYTPVHAGMILSN